MNSITEIKLPDTMYLDMAVSDVCNMHCKHCHIWTNKGGGNKVTSQRRVSLIHEFARLHGKKVFFTGGEVTKNLDDLTYILDVCKSRKLLAGFATNGSYIDERHVADRILSCEPDHIILSIDSHEEKLHDWVRGEGSYNSVVNAMKYLVSAKKDSGSNTTLIFQQVLFKKNLPLFDKFIEFAKKIGVDFVDWQMLCGTYNNQSHHDPFFEQNFWHSDHDKLVAKTEIERILTKYESDLFLRKKLSDLEFVFDYIENPQVTTNVICDSADKNVVINYKGEVALCFSEPGCYPYIGNINDNNLKDILFSQEAQLVRSHMATCRKGCGIQECHRKKHQKLTLKVLQ